MIETLGVLDQETEASIIPDLKIARIANLGSNDKLLKICGIPFQVNQLQSCSFKVGERRVALIDLMNELDLIGDTNGVPHLSVGGGVTLPGIYRQIYIPANIARSYLVNGGLGIKGGGLIDYDIEHGNQGFGIGDFIPRSSGVSDIAGGLSRRDAKHQKDLADNLYTLSYLQAGASSFARIFGTYKFITHEVFSYATESMEELHILVREDGQRGMSKKTLINSLPSVLPLLTDFWYSPNDFLEPDGHNAFFRDGSVVFTDYEASWCMEPEYVTYIFELQDSWFIEALRKDFKSFARMYSFDMIGYPPNFDLNQIRQHLHTIVSHSNYYEDSKQALLSSFQSGDNKKIIRQAMIGSMCSRARARQIGHMILSEEIERIISSRDDKMFTLEEIYTQLSETSIGNKPSHEITGREGCKILTNTGFEFELEIETFGLPLRNIIRIPVTLADIYHSWPTEDKDELKDLSLPENPFSGIPEDIISRSVYASIASAIFNIRGLRKRNTFTLSTQEKRLQGYDLEAYNDGKIIFCADNHFDIPDLTCRYSNLINFRFKDGKLFVESDPDLGYLSITELNKLAYMVNTIIIYLIKNPSSRLDVVDLYLGDNTEI